MTRTRRLPRDAFRTHLGDLSAGSFVRFVGDLHEVQGWTVSRDGPILDLSREAPIATRRTVLAIAGPTDSSDDVDRAVDVVASPRRPRSIEALATDLGARLLGPDDLYDLAMFGVDREATTSLLGEHFGRDAIAEASAPPSTREAPGAEGDDEASGSADSSADASPRGAAVDSWRWSRPDRSAVLPVAALLAVIVVLAGVGGALDPALLLGSGSSVDAPGAAAAPTTEESTTTTGPASTGGAPEGSDAGLFEDANTSAAAIQPRYVELTPTCERPPGLVAVIIVESLRNNDPETDDGIRTAWNFSSRKSRRTTYGIFHRFVTGDEFAPLFDFESATYTPAYRDPGVSAHRVTVTDRTGASHTYVFVLSDGTGSNRKGCWLLAGIVVE